MCLQCSWQLLELDPSSRLPNYAATGDFQILLLLLIFHIFAPTALEVSGVSSSDWLPEGSLRAANVDATLSGRLNIIFNSHQLQYG